MHQLFNKIGFITKINKKQCAESWMLVTPGSKYDKQMLECMLSEC